MASSLDTQLEHIFRGESLTSNGSEFFVIHLIVIDHLLGHKLGIGCIDSPANRDFANLSC